ncbi:MAG: 3-oxoacyl-ACP reductase FabG [Gammaproteobacteria bacterium]
MSSFLKQAQLESKIAIVTGASRGIGQAIAFTLAELGALVIGTATTQKGADAISAQFEEKGLKGIGRVLDIADVAQLSSFIEGVTNEFNGLHILVNNAGITRDNLLLRMKEEDWQSVIQTNLTGVALLCKAALKPMMKARWGRIINISSVVGTMGNPGQCNYAAAKAGLIGFTKSLAREIASRNVTVNVVSPGFIDTDMTKSLPDVQRQALLTQVPLGRLGASEDIANAVAFLATDLSSYITGETVHVNGGMLMG